MTKLQRQIASFSTYLGEAAPHPDTLAAVTEETQLRVLKARCRMWARDRAPPDVLVQLDTEAVAAGDPPALQRAQFAVGAAAVHQLRAWLRAPDLTPDDRDRLLALLLDFLALLDAEGVNLAPVVPPELRDVL